MNKKHVSKVGKYISMACLLFACVVVQSCRDEYYYDDREPDFLGSSIYNYLKEQGDFTLFLKVIDDLQYGEVLAKTGSKTLFVADDKAFMEGIEKEWGITDYAELTTAHKRIILNSAMLDNAYLLEMLSKMQSTGTNAEPVPGQCVRRETSASVVDTIGLFPYKNLPKNNPDWDIFKDGSVRLALDATPSLMLHLVQDFLYQETVDESDLQAIVSNPNANWNDIYIYDKRVIKEKSDVTCKNGYVHQLDGLLIPPSNMAEELRKNGEEVSAKLEKGAFTLEDVDSTTYIFSRMLDRFAVPVPIDKNSDVAETYYFRYPERVGEQLYEKKYYVEGKMTAYEDVDGTPHNAVGSLIFNPGWNAYEAEGTKKERDMAAIFAPSDKALITYFTQGLGKELITQYGWDIEDNLDYTKGLDKGLFQAIDSIPLDVLEKLVNNHMQVSFVSTVPSKFRNIVDDARDALGIVESDLAKTMLANNGVVYVTNRVYRPARFASVIAPVMLSDSLYVFNQMIESEGYDSYLLSMQNKFGLVVTSDSNMFYFDPKTERTRGDRKIYKFMRVDIPNAQTGTIESSVKVKECTQVYDTKTKTYGNITEQKDYYTGNVSDLYKEILEYNIVKGNLNDSTDCKEGRKYYESKGYGSIKVQRGIDGTGLVSAIAGGRELQQGVMIPLACEASEKENGWTFQLAGSLMQPPTQSVLDVFTDTLDSFTGKCFNRFYRDLCVPNTVVLETILGPESKNKQEWDKFRVFDNGDNKVVKMFNTFNYTVYVPTEQALEIAYSQGLKTWEQLATECNEIIAMSKNDPQRKEREAQLKADAYLIAKFVRYHFQDGAVFVDNPRHAQTTQRGQGKYDYDYTVEYSTSALNDSTNRFSKVVIQTDVAKNTIAVRGDFGEDDDELLENCANVCYVINTDPTAENKKFNVMTRDIIFSGSTISTSSYAVVHLIDNFLVYGGRGGIYDAQKQQFITYTGK